MQFGPDKPALDAYVAGSVKSAAGVEAHVRNQNGETLPPLEWKPGVVKVKGK